MSTARGQFVILLFILVGVWLIADYAGFYYALAFIFAMYLVLSVWKWLLRRAAEKG